MSAADWKKLPALGLSPIGEGLVVNIEVRVEEVNDVYPVLISVRRDAARLAKGGEVGTWEAQWCNSAARISIARAT